MDVAGRDAKEQELAKTVAEELAKAQRKIVSAVIDGATMVPEDLWGEIAQDLQKAIMPVLQSTFLDQAEGMLGEFDGIGVDWALVNQAAVTWARSYSFDLVKDIADKSRAVCQQAIGNFFELGQTRQELVDALTPTFGAVRAESIAVTETTRAASRGEDGLTDELAKSGIYMDEYWQTERDVHVCPICKPRNGKQRGDGWTDPPPAHPR